MVLYMKASIHSWSYLARFFLKENISDKKCRDTPNTHFMFHNFFFENRAVYEIMWKNVDRGRPQMKVWRVCIACWIPKATNTHTDTQTHTHTHTHTGCVILIVFPLQQCLQERASMLRPTYIALFTPWSRVLLERLASSQLVKKFSAFYGTPRFITAFTGARHLSLS